MPAETPMDLASRILEWVEERRPSEYSPWLPHEVRELGVLLARWRAAIVEAANHREDPPEPA
jgi:hypothetical protein